MNTIITGHGPMSECDTMIGMVVNEREWMTRMLYMMIEHVHCSRVNQSSNGC